MATKFNPITYSKNLAKSLGYATFDAIIGDSVFKDAYDENKDSVSEIYQNIRNFAKDPKNTIRSSEFAKEYSPIIKDGFKNLMDDIKSGNIYNKDRADQAMFDSMFGGEEGGFDFDFDDFEDSSSFEEEPITDGSSALAAKAQTIATGQNIKAMDIVGKTTAKAINTTTARSAQYLAQAQQASTQLILKQQTKMFNQVSVGLAGVNQSLGSLVSLGEPLTAHMQNSMKFYTETSQKLDKMISLLEGVSKAVTPAQQQGTNRSYKGIDSYLTSSGAISLSGMKEMLGRNFGRAIDSSPLGMLTGFQIGEDGKGLWKQMAANPLGTILSLALPNLLPKSFTDSIDKLGKSLAGFNVELIKRLSKMNGNPVKDFIGSLFGYDDTLNTKIDTSRYNKGKVDFDGKARKAIIEVIPTYLSKILAALTGGFETRFDYDKGRFVNRQQIKEQYREIFSREARSIGYDVADTDDIRTSYYKSSGGQTKLSRSQAEKIQRDFNKYVENAIKTNNIIDPRKLNSMTDEDAKKYGFKDKAMMKNVIELYQSYMKSGDSHRLMALARSINQARLSISASFDDMSGDNIFGNLFNGGFEDYIHGGMSLAALGIGSGGKRGSSNQKRQRANEYYQKNANRQKYRIEFSHRELERRYGDKKIPNTIEKEWEKLFSDSSFTSNKERQDFIDKVNESTGYSEDRFPGIDESTGFEYDASATGIRKIAQTAKRIVQSPLSVVTSILNKADKTLFEVLYGKVDKEGNVIDDDGHHSVLGIMFNNMKDMFTTFKDWMKDNIFNPVRKFFDDRGGFKGMISSIFGIDVDELLSTAKTGARILGRNIINNFKSVGTWSWGKLKELPSQFGSGSTISARRYYGRATTPIKDPSDELLQEAYSEINKGRTIKEVAAELNIDYSTLQKRNKAENPEWKFRTEMRKFKRSAKKIINDKSGIVYKTGQELNNGLMTFLHQIIPDDKDLDTTAKKTKDVVKESLKSLGVDPSGAITGALMGGGISILSGGIISPLIAASIGGAAGLIIKSESLQNLLFGEEDENGERHGKILSERLTKILTKELPEAAGFGIAGGLAGLIPGMPGGPIGGMFIGSAIGFAKNSRTVQNFLFGNEEEGTSGILGTEEDKKEKIDWLKKMAPKAATGAILGAIAGPFGFAGNIFMGAALGFASETELFKRVLFGEEDANGERHGGITRWIREDIIKPVAESLTPIRAEIQYRAKDFTRMLIKGISNVFKEHLVVPFKDKLNDFIKGRFGRLLLKAASGIGDVVSTPFRLVGAYGNHLRRKQVRQGRAGYLSARERLDYRRNNGLGNDAYTAFDTNLMGMDEADLSSLKSSIVNVRRNKEYKKSSHEALQHQQSIVTAISHTAGSKAGKIAKNVLEAGGDIDKVIQEVSSAGYNISSIEADIRQNYEDYTAANKAVGAASSETQNIINDIMKRTGLKSFNDRDAMKALDSVNAEIHARKNGTQAVKQDPVAMQNTLIKEHGENIEAKLVDIHNAIIQLLPIGADAKSKLYKSGGSEDLARNRESITKEESFGDGYVHVQNNQSKRETMYSRLFMGNQYKNADPFLGFDENERAAIEIAFTNMSRQQNPGKNYNSGTVNILQSSILDDVYTVTVKDKSVVVQLVNGVPQYVPPLKHTQLILKAMAKGTLAGIGKAMKGVYNVGKKAVGGIAKGIGKVAGGIKKGFDWAFERYNPYGEDEGSGSGLIPAARYYRGGGIGSTILSGLKTAGSKVGSWLGGKLLGGSNEGGDSQSFLEKILTPQDVSDEGFLSGALAKINASKFNPKNFLSGSTDYNLGSKEEREAFRKEQSTLNIFRQTGFTTDQISQKMDILISGLMGISAGAGGSGKGSKGGLLGKILSGVGLIAAGAGLGYAMYTGKLDKAAENMYQSVDGDNTKPGSGAFSSVTITDPNTGEVVELATDGGSPVIETDEEGNQYYVSVYGDKIPVDSKNPPQYRGTSGFASKIKSYLFGKSVLTGSRNGIISLPRKIVTKGIKKFAPKLGTRADQWIDNALYGGIKNKGEQMLRKIPAVAKFEDKLATTKFGQLYLKQMGKETADKAAKLTADRFKSVFGKNAKSYMKEFAEGGSDHFILTHYDDLGEDTLRYLTEHSDDIAEGGMKKFYSGALEKVGQKISNLTKKSSIEAIEKATAKESTKGMKDAIRNAITKFSKALSKNSKAVEALGSSDAIIEFGERFSNECCEHIDDIAADKLAKGTEIAVKEGADLIPIGGIVLGIAFSLYEFEEGWNSAERTWKVLNPNTMERFISGIIPAYFNLIGMIPGVSIVDWLPWDWMMGTAVDILESVGVNLGELSKQRDEAQKYLDEINSKRLVKNKNAQPWSFDELAVASKKEGGLNARTWGEKIKGATKTALNRIGTEASEKNKKAAQLVNDFKKGLISEKEYKQAKRSGEVGLTEEDFLVGFGSGLRGRGGFVSQISPNLANVRFGGSTFGENGCAPAVASMLTGMPVGSTAGYALGGGYTNNAGTSADYFGNLFAQNGISSEYVFTGAGSAQDYLASRISSGHPTVLLGQDYSNTSKANSPFGPGNHYVLATGTDSRGNIIVQDPEASRPNITYDRSILNSVKLGIPTGGSSRLMRKHRAGIKRAFMFRGGASFEITENHKQIWTYLTKNVGLSEAGAAGLMGCWQAESKNNPKRVEGDYLADFPGYEAIMNSDEIRSNWTRRVINGTKAIKDKEAAISRYFINGVGYPGVGLAQWTRGRAHELLTWCNSKNYNWAELRSQLEFANYELKNKYSSVYSALKSATDVMAACKIAFNKYEGGSKESWLQERQNYAIAIYNALSGKTYNVPTTTGTASGSVGSGDYSSGAVGATGAAASASTGSSDATEDSSSGGGLLSLGSMFGKLFSSALGPLGKLFGFGDYDDETSSTGETGSYGSTGQSGSSDYSGNVISPDGTQTTSLKPLPNLNSSHAINFVNAALSQKGYVETPDNITDFGKYTGADGQPWCASFVSWAMNKAFKGNRDNAAKAMYGGPTAAVGTLWDRFKKNNAMSSTPAVGDIVIYKNGTSHTGIVTDVNGTMIKTVEGNTSGDASFSRNGGMVWTKEFDYTKKGNLTGFGRPNWGAVDEDATQMGANDSRTSGSIGSDVFAGIAAGRQRAGISAGSERTTNYGEYMNSLHGRGSGLYNVAQAGYNTINRQHAHARSVFGGGSGVVNLSKLSESSRNRYISALKQYAGSGSMGNEAMMALIKGIISLLSNVSANSDQIKEAVVVLNKILEATSNGSAGTTNNTTNISAGDLNVDDTDNTIREMQQLLNNLAAGA